VRPPDVLLRAVPIRHDRHKALAVGVRVSMVICLRIRQTRMGSTRGNPKSDANVRSYPLGISYNWSVPRNRCTKTCPSSAQSGRSWLTA
jgi:hypothetical protein